MLVIIGEFAYWFDIYLLFYYFLIFLLNYIFKKFLITLFYFLLLFFFLSFLSPLSSEPCGWQGLGALAGLQACASEVGEPSSGPPETSQPHVISISEDSPRDLNLNAKTQLYP